MTELKRAWKLHEFVAHGSNVNCVSLGNKSGRVLATGGEDRKVNIWSIDKPNCIMTLQGHTTPVECVRFGHSEEMVAAGSMSGALKVWDLEQAKIMRTLTGHKAAIRSLDFHPYGDYTASASLDSNIKLWDIKRKGCIYTYKGHTNGVNCLRFSPDGKWIASGGEDGLIKIWDLNAGKLLTDLKGHVGPVNTVEFHPNELLLASGSSDKTVKFWDLEGFHIVDSTEENATPIRSIGFHPDGVCLYCGSGNLARVYGWEPTRLYDTLTVGWGDVADISFARHQLIGASFSQTNVSTFVIDTQRVQPLGSPTADDGSEPVVDMRTSSTTSPRKSFVMDRPPTQCSSHPSAPRSDSIEPPSAPSPDDPCDPTADIKLVDDYHAVFGTRNKLARSPPTTPRTIPAPAVESKRPSPPPISTPVDEPTKAPPVRASAPPAQKRTESPSTKRAETRPASPSNLSRGDFKRPDSGGQRRPESAGKRAESKRNETPRRTAAATPAATTPKEPSVASSPRDVSNNIPALQQRQKINPEDFLPTAEQKRSMREEDVLAAVAKGHPAVTTVLSGRSRNLQIVRAMWTAGNTKNAVDSAVSMGDQAVMVDILNVLNDKANLWTLDICSILMPQLVDLINSKYDHYAETASTSVKLIIKNLGPVIKANITATHSIGVDISHEERYRKCNTMYQQLQNVRSCIEKKSHLSTVLSREFREIIILLGTLD